MSLHNNRFIITQIYNIMSALWLCRDNKVCFRELVLQCPKTICKLLKSLIQVIYHEHNETLSSDQLVYDSLIATD